LKTTQLIGDDKISENAFVINGYLFIVYYKRAQAGYSDCWLYFYGQIKGLRI
jgi:hypothetical protein